MFFHKTLDISFTHSNLPIVWKPENKLFSIQEAFKQVFCSRILDFRLTYLEEVEMEHIPYTDEPIQEVWCQRENIKFEVHENSSFFAKISSYKRFTKSLTYFSYIVEFVNIEQCA